MSVSTTQDIESPEREEQEMRDVTQAVASDPEFSTAQGVGCLVSFVLAILLLVVPKFIALWEGLHSDGTWVYPPIGVLVFWLLTVTTLLTGKIPYRSEDMDLNEMPLLKYVAAVVFTLAGVGMYVAYLAVVFGW